MAQNIQIVLAPVKYDQSSLNKVLPLYTDTSNLKIKPKMWLIHFLNTAPGLYFGKICFYNHLILEQVYLKSYLSRSLSYIIFMVFKAKWISG